MEKLSVQRWSRSVRLTFHGVFELFHFAFLSNNETRAFFVDVLWEIVAIEGNARRIVATIFQTMQTIDQNIGNKLAVSFDQVIQITEDS